ncbi:hypothetical protein PACTADRAFT_2047 [Pachysolen tannophilus NRRL Y-2460]|uniref:Adenosine kinase n=1 Tax=Pachysolen tannophilus NRRL Y-2460 TaxID=669874 RepID=A0A1E4TVC5_PACTA|nr:hypothetical protein PACTADRAFT_2047 [Pachysolen tannophilus NRRL Y-2460]
MSFPLVCLGNPLLDMQINVDKTYLDKYGLKENDAILVEPHQMPIFDECLSNPSLKLVAGGAAQNTARGAQYLLPKDSVVYFGSVGNDKYAEKLIEANRSVGLRTEYMVQSDHSTGKCAALINGNNRSLATDLGAANEFKPEHLLKPENWKLIEAAKFFYIGGFHLTVSPEAIKLLGEHAAKTNKVFALNFSAPFIPQFFKDPLDQVIPYTDYVICNESEADSYAKSHDLDTTDLKEIAKSIAKLTKVNTKRDRVVIFTQGLDPTLSVTYKIEKNEFEIKEYPVHPLETSKIVDTNGAGDAFAAGFMAGLVEGNDLDQSIDMGQWLAALSIQEVGPSYPFPKKSYK